MPLDVTIDHARLLAAINAAHSIAEKRTISGSASLNSILLDADPKKGLTVTATDMSLTSTEVLDVRLDTEVAKAGGLLVPARYLQAIVRSMPTGPIRLKEMDNHWAEITAKRSSFKIMGQAVRDFPDIPQLPKEKAFSKMATPLLLNLIEATLASISTDEARVNLNGLLFESTGKHCTAVSTDGHRLTKLKVELPGPKLDRGVILPRKGVLALQSLITRTKAGEVEIAVDAPGWMFARVGGLTLSIKLNNVVFPPYEQVIPKTCMREAVVLRDELVLMLKRSTVIAPEKTSTVRLTFSSKSKTLEITASNPDLGDVKDEIEMDSYSGGDLLAGYNAEYLLDALGVILTKQVRLSMQGELDPMAISPVDGPDFVGVVMPMRV